MPPLIQDLGFLLLTGGSVALLFSFLRQPLIVGYLLAGFLIGPNFNHFPQVTDPESIRLWGEIGVLFLLFSLGLEFSFKKLLSMGPSSLVAASIEVVGVLFLGFWVSRQLGYSAKEALFLGAMVSISSTAVLLRAFSETGTRSARFAQNVLGILIVEDLYAVLLLVLLATVTVGRVTTGAETGTEAVLGTLFNFGFFVTVAFVIGISILPSLIRRAQRLLSDEMRLVLSLGFCFMAVALASHLGFSPTLGAFVMGSLLAGTREAKRIEVLLLPVQQLFGAIFFISVGMLIEPSALVRQPVAAVSLLAVILVGKPFLVALGSVVAGKPLKPALRSGVSMGQIGEFSFIMASLGVARGILQPDTSSLVVMLATVTALTTTYSVRGSKIFATLVDGWIPPRWKRAIDRYSAGVQRGGGNSEWRLMLRRQAEILIVNSALIGAVVLLCTRFGTEYIPHLGLFLIALFACAPFFWGIAKAGLKGEKLHRYWINPQLRPILVFVLLVRAVVFFALAGFLIARFFELPFALVASAVVFGGGLLFFSRRVEDVYERFAQRFLLSLSETEMREAEENRASPRAAAADLGPWEGHIEVFAVSYDSLAAGKTFGELSVRERYGVTVTQIERGDRKIPVPSRSERIYPGDLLHAVGTDEQLAAFRNFVEVAVAEPLVGADALYSLQSIPVAPNSVFAGKSIRACGIREIANGLVVGIERAGKRILNPPADFLIESGDLLWIVGQNEKFRELETDRQSRL